VSVRARRHAQKCVHTHTQCAYKMNKTTVVNRWGLPDYDYSLQDQVTAR
jgi:hypothetical protein